MLKSAAVNLARDTVRNGRFHADLARRVAIRTVSQDPNLACELRRYLESVAADITDLGFESTIHESPDPLGVDVKSEDFLTAIKDHLRVHGHLHVSVREALERGAFPATRLDPRNPAATWAARSIEKTLGVRPVIVPNLGRTLPNDCFALELGMPTLWISHSYQDCRQHAGDEHLLAGLVEEGLMMMTGLFWGLGVLQSPWWRGGEQFGEAAEAVHE